MFRDKTLLITGGTGTFGNAVLGRFLQTDIAEIRVFSRDEKEQEDMRLSYNKQDKHKAVVRVDYDATGYQISYESSTNLYEEVGEDGAKLIHPTYNMWVRNLLARIMIPGELAPASAVKSEEIK